MTCRAVQSPSFGNGTVLCCLYARHDPDGEHAFSIPPPTAIAGLWLLTSLWRFLLSYLPVSLGDVPCPAPSSLWPWCQGSNWITPMVGDHPKNMLPSCPTDVGRIGCDGLPPVLHAACGPAQCPTPAHSFSRWRSSSKHTWQQLTEKKAQFSLCIYIWKLN